MCRICVPGCHFEKKRRNNSLSHLLGAIYGGYSKMYTVKMRQPQSARLLRNSHLITQRFAMPVFFEIGSTSVLSSELLSATRVVIDHANLEMPGLNGLAFETVS